MRIVNVEDFFLPDAGYQINIVPKYLSEFGHDVFIITSTLENIQNDVIEFFGIENIELRDKEYEERTDVKIIRLKPFISKVISGRIIPNMKLFKVIDSLNPDIVYAHGNDTLTGILSILKKNRKYALITDSHMLQIASNNKFSWIFKRLYKKMITPTILKKNIPVIRTQKDNYVSKYLGIPLEKSPWISYGSDLSVFHPNKKVKHNFMVEHGIDQNSFIFIYAGKINKTKGGKFLAKAFLNQITNMKPVVLITVGNFEIESSKEIKSIFLKSENKIINFPTQNYLELAKFYQVADASIFPCECSLSFYDVQACGLPVISEDNNINLDRNSHGNGICFKSNDLLSFRKSLEMIATMNTQDYLRMSNNALYFVKDNYDYEKKAREYERILIKTFEEQIR